MNRRPAAVCFGKALTAEAGRVRRVDLYMLPSFVSGNGCEHERMSRSSCLEIYGASTDMALRRAAYLHMASIII